MNDFLRDPAIITIGSERAGATVDQEFMIVENREKLTCLEELIGTCDQRVLVFCDTKIQTSEIAKSLTERKFKCETIHGDLD